MNKPNIQVVAAIIRNTQNQIYITQRLTGKDFAQYFEFPGGKIETGESPEDTLIRELQEEIDITPLQYQLFHQFSFEYPQKHIDFYFYQVTQWQGMPFGKEGQQGFWLEYTKLDSNKFPPANKIIIEKLKETK